jgi:hypothetical protein
MVAEAGRVQSPAGASQSPFAALASTGGMNRTKVAAGGEETQAHSKIVHSKPPRMPGSGDVASNLDGSNQADEVLDSPVSGLVDSTPTVPTSMMQSAPSGILKEEGSVRGGAIDGMKRTVSWADFSHEDPARLTQVVEFERDGPSSPTSVDSWDEQDRAECRCCWIQ